MQNRPLAFLRNATLILLGLFGPATAVAQFYNGSQQEYGKNRVQYQDFLWQYYRFPELETYFYKGGRDVARYVAISAHRNKKDLEKFFDFTIDERVQFIVYSSLGDLRQSNIGIGTDDSYNIGGVTRIVGTKVFVYNEGEHSLLDRQVRGGLAQLIIDQMMYGGNWREVIRNSTLLNLPAWYTKGLSAYCAGPWQVNEEDHIRDGVLSGRYEKFNRLEGNDATMAGLAIWTYVAETYGASVIPNILYMTRVSRNPESGFNYVLGVSLNTLMRECLDHYRNRYLQEERTRADVGMEELKVKTRKTRTYSEFRLSPDGRYAAWVSNELGQYKVWLYDRAEKKVKRIAKGEKKLNRIIDLSFPVLAWHPTGRALTWTSERKGELYLTTYTLDDKKKARKPVFMLEKILSMAYSPDGQNMVFSGVLEGRTDLYLYHTIGNRQEALTNDLYDDLDPSFADGGRSILFVSDRPDDTLRSNGDVHWYSSNKDIYIYDLETRSPYLTRLTDTPGAEERQPMQYDSAHYAFLSDDGHVRDRWLAQYDSTISTIDTTIHYRYFTTTSRVTDLKRGIEQHDIIARRGWLSQLMYSNGKYHFYTGFAREGSQDDQGAVPPGPDQRESPSGNTITDDMSTVVKVPPRDRPDTTAEGVDIRNYRFMDEPADGGGTVVGSTGTQTPGATGAAADSTLITTLVFPEQRNYNVNFATDEVQTQLDNSFDGQFYQPISGDGTMNPGLSVRSNLAMTDLMEDRRVSGGVRLSFGLDNMGYMLKYANVMRRIDKEITLQRQAMSLAYDFGLLKVVTHQASIRYSYPFSELASVRLTGRYRNDHFTVQSIDGATLRAPDFTSQDVSAKLEYVYDSSLPRGLNLWTGWKLKVFGEYYRQPDQSNSDMQVVGLDFRHSLRVHRDLIWVTRLAGSSTLGSRKVLFFLGGVDNWLFPKVDTEQPIDATQNYYYLGFGVPVRGFFYNARNGSAFSVFNTEFRVPVFRYLLNRPIRSDFFQNFQVVAFGDLGAAWTGSNPYAEDNSFNQQVVQNGALTITIKNNREPIIGGYGFGLRTRLLGYFVRADWAWGVDDGVILDNVFHFSLSLDL